MRLLDGERRSLIIMSPWGQPIAETLRQVWPELTPAERVDVWAAFNLGGDRHGDRCAGSSRTGGHGGRYGDHR